jgi:protein-S-isoprenylcysteine O-methyltransferase Ste14
MQAALFSLLAGIGWMPMLMRLRSTRPRGTSSSDRILLMLTWILCLVLIATSVRDFAHTTADSRGRIAAGITLQWIAMGCWTWSRTVMGTSFAQIGVPPDLIVRGPYRRLRHPMYAATIIAAFGMAVAGGRERDFVVWCALIAVLLVRAAREELVLRKTFGSRWEAYARESLGLIPSLQSAPG